MSSLANCQMLGRITQELTLKYTPNGKAVLDFSVAVNNYYKKGENKVEEVSFFDCVAWGRTAEIMAEYVKKGDLVSFQAEMRQERWEDKETKAKRSKIKLHVQQLQLLPNNRKVEVTA